MSASETILKQNDRQAAIKEFRENYRINPNAEELIQANNSGYSAALREASLTPIDEVATKKLQDAGVHKLADKTTVGGYAVSDIGEPIVAAVRGNAIVVGIKTPDGRIAKEVIPANDRYEAPRETPSEAAARAVAMSNVELTAEVQSLREELAAELTELRRERENAAGEKIAEAQASVAERVGEAQEAAAEAIEAGEESVEVREHPATRGGGDSSEKVGGISQAKADPAEGGGGDGGDGDSDGGDAKFPRTHDDLDALAKKHKVEWPEGMTKVDDKIAHLTKSGVKPG